MTRPRQLRPVVWKRHTSAGSGQAQVFSARLAGFVMTVTEWTSGTIVAVISRRRAIDGGYDRMGENRTLCSTTAAQRYCERTVRSLATTVSATGAPAR